MRNVVVASAVRTNPNGGAIAVGHPVDVSGAIIPIKLACEPRRTSGRYGLATMCSEGSQGIAVLVEKPAYEERHP